MARRALAEHPASEQFTAAGHFALEVMSGLRGGRAADHAFRAADIEQALLDTEQFEVAIDAIPWGDVHRAWALSSALRYADALYVALPLPADYRAEASLTDAAAADGLPAVSGEYPESTSDAIRPGAVAGVAGRSRQSDRP